MCMELTDGTENLSVNYLFIYCKKEFGNSRSMRRYDILSQVTRTASEACHGEVNLAQVSFHGSE
jgi:hypothetical protein